MKREIKFRSWDSEKEIMHDVDSIYYGSRGYGKQLVSIDSYDESKIPYYRITLEQFTGLKDKNGVEIYEGDIVKTGTDKVMVIGWSQKHASFVIDREGWVFRHYFGEAFYGEDCEVIGNIHQNPELL